MNQIMRALLVCFLLAGSSFQTVYSQSLRPSRKNSTGRTQQVFQHQRQNTSLTEEFSFSIKDFKVDHQSENNTLNISVVYRYIPGIANTAYPDFRLLAKDVENFLTNYPNEKDYWEIVNKNLTSLLMKKYPVIATITCEITVDPLPNSPYVRSSRTTRRKG